MWTPSLFGLNDAASLLVAMLGTHKDFQSQRGYTSLAALCRVNGKKRSDWTVQMSFKKDKQGWVLM